MDRRMQGRRSREDGLYFEDVIQASSDFYERRGIAVVQKTPEPMRVLRSLGRGQFVACFNGMAQPDFKGILCDGTMVLFDAKSTTTGKLHRDVVTSEQEKDFERYGKMGAHCFILATLNFEDYYRVPWDIFKTMKERYGHKYMDAGELEPYKLLTAGNVIRYLDGIEINVKDNEQATEAAGSKTGKA